MQILTGRVRGREIKKNRDGTTNKILLQVELTSPDDIQTVEWINHDGEDSSPPDNSLVVVLAVSNSYKIAIACDDEILAESQPGEKKIYSSDGGVIKAFLKLFKTALARLSAETIEILSTATTKIEAGGDVEITAAGDADMTAGVNAKMEAAVNAEVTSILTEINGTAVHINGFTDNAVRFSQLDIQMTALNAALNTHVHDLTLPGPPGSFSGTPSIPFVLNILASKVLSVFLP